MKKTLFLLIFVMWASSSQAQIRFSIAQGISVPHLSRLNNTLSKAGFQTFQPLIYTMGMSLEIPFDDFMSGNFLYLYSYQNRSYEMDKGVSFRNAMIGYSFGVKVINKFKTKLEPLLGIGWTPRYGSTTIRVRMNTPVSAGTLISNQLVAPTNQILELQHQSRFSWHIGTKYSFKLKYLSLGVQLGYYGRISKSRWFIGNVELADNMPINPTGFYSMLLMNF